MTSFLRKHHVAAASGIALAIALSCPAQTDNSKSSSLLALTMTKVKPEMISEYETLTKNELNPALKKGGMPFRQVWVTANFGDLNQYVSVSPIEKFADYDGTPLLDRALGKDGAATLRAKLRRCIVDTHRVAIRTRSDLSIMKDSVEPKMAVVTSLRIAIGKGPDYENWLKNDLLPVLRKSDVDGYWVNQTVFGGDVSEWTALTLIRNYADLDGDGPLVRAVGQEGATKLLAKAATFVTSVERSIARTRPDLSFSAAQAKAGSQ